jgi:hypothetical protein
MALFGTSIPYCEMIQNKILNSFKFANFYFCLKGVGIGEYDFGIESILGDPYARQEEKVKVG